MGNEQSHVIARFLLIHVHRTTLVVGCDEFVPFHSPSAAKSREGLHRPPPPPTSKHHHHNHHHHPQAKPPPPSRHHHHHNYNHHHHQKQRNLAKSIFRKSFLCAPPPYTAIQRSIRGGPRVADKFYPESWSSGPTPPKERGWVGG